MEYRVQRHEWRTPEMDILVPNRNFKHMIKIYMNTVVMVVLEVPEKFEIINYNAMYRTDSA